MYHQNSLQERPLASRQRAVLLLSLILVLGTLLVWLGPNEKTLGNGIKAVYVHVALTWAGMVGFGVAGLLGIAVLFRPQPRVDRWRVATGWVAFGFYLGGLVISALASQINWGALFWQEPRMATSLNVLAVALLFQAANLVIPWRRVTALLTVLLPIFVVWINGRTELVLHPGNAVRASTAPAIQLTFLAMFVLVLLAESVLVWWTQQKPKKTVG